ncbi:MULTISPECIES: hypothetical protein [Actinoplanes]|uniref:hypothetical protein n=1 Tax=Actinoplanes TaxID=1865 RepID=UPI0005F298F1|nr:MULTISPECIES: hypothetical protein [Actinoplanes]GLY00513.1 hypothetical protein Acsp01_08920 [Actinoplanes sp. NBRC 101535]
MGTNDGDARIVRLFFTETAKNTAVTTLDDAAGYEVHADIEIGKDLNESVSHHLLRVVVVNLFTGAVVGSGKIDEPLKAQEQTFRTETLKVTFPAPGGVAAGDVLVARASYKVEAGVNFDISNIESTTVQIV